MANAGYGCEFGDCPTQPTHLITDIGRGSTVSLCDEHYGVGLIPLLASELGVDPGEFYTQVEKFINAQAKKAEKAIANAQAALAAESSDGPDGSSDDGQAYHVKHMDEIDSGAPSSTGGTGHSG